MRDARARAPGHWSDRVTAWVGRSDPAPAGHAVVAEPPAQVRARAMRRLYDDIGEFLFGNRLDLTPLNFGCAHDYLTRSDREVERAVGLALVEGAVSNEWIEGFFDARPADALKSDVLHDVAETVERELGGYVEIVAQNRESTQRYGAALAMEAGAPGARDTAPDAERLIALTRVMIDKTRATEAAMRDSEKRIQRLRATLRDARRAAELDHLTQLPNRRAFEAGLDKACEAARASGRSLHVVLCDIDHFKAVNDAHGHDTGDRVLVFVATELRERLQGRGLVARYGGEEFVMLLEGMTLDAAHATVDSIREGLASRRLIDRASKRSLEPLTFSAGIAAVDDLATPRDALKRADTALYAAKQGGRDRVFVCTDTMYVGPPRR